MNNNNNNNIDKNKEIILFFDPLGSQGWCIMDFEFFKSKTLAYVSNSTSLLKIRFNVHYSIEEIEQKIFKGGKKPFNITASFLKDEKTFQYYYQIELDEIEETTFNKLFYPELFLKSN